VAAAGGCAGASDVASTDVGAVRPTRTREQRQVAGIMELNSSVAKVL
jgi:hypothetical protein